MLHAAPVTRTETVHVLHINSEGSLTVRKIVPSIAEAGAVCWERDGTQLLSSWCTRRKRAMLPPCADLRQLERLRQAHEHGPNSLERRVQEGQATRTPISPIYMRMRCAVTLPMPHRQPRTRATLTPIYPGHMPEFSSCPFDSWRLVTRSPTLA